MKNTPYLTEGFEPILARQIACSRHGMAHFAATGPFGATCGQCVNHGYWQQIQNAAGDTVGTRFRTNACSKYFELTGQHGPPVPACTEACRHFVRKGP